MNTFDISLPTLLNTHFKRKLKHNVFEKQNLFREAELQFHCFYHKTVGVESVFFRSDDFRSMRSTFNVIVR